MNAEITHEEGPAPGNFYPKNWCGHSLETKACYTASWEDRIKEVARYEMLLGTLEGLRYRVNPGTRLVIENALSQIKPNPVSPVPSGADKEV